MFGYMIREHSTPKSFPSSSHSWDSANIPEVFQTRIALIRKKTIPLPCYKDKDTFVVTVKKQVKTIVCFILISAGLSVVALGDIIYSRFNGLNYEKEKFP